MNNLKIIFAALAIPAMLILQACQEDDPGITPNNPPPDQDQLDSGRIAVDSCTFAYADTLFFLREQSTDYIISPISADTGTYGAYPEGLDIDVTNGDINISQSETGLKYEVFFIPQGQTDSCKTTIIISGINYLSGVFVLDQNDTMALPYYNAQQGLAPPCSDDDDDDDDDDGDDDDDDDDNECEFDDGADDDDGDGTADEPAPGQEIIPLGIDVNKATGIINLQQTVNNGTFGATPVSGTFVDVKMFYRIDDASNGALNSIDIRFYYYDFLTNVPQSLLDGIDDKNGKILRRKNNARLKAGPPRPPHILIVGRLQLN